MSIYADCWTKRVTLPWTSAQNGNTKRTPIPSDSPLFAKPDASAAAASNHTADPAFQKIR